MQGWIRAVWRLLLLYIILWIYVTCWGATFLCFTFPVKTCEVQVGVFCCVLGFFFKKSIYIWEVFCDNGTEELRVTSSYSSNMVFRERDHALALVLACWLGKVWETLIFLSNVTVHSVDWESQKVIYSSYSLFEIACCSRLLIKQVTLCRRANELLCHTDMPCLALAFSKLN